MRVLFNRMAVAVLGVLACLFVAVSCESEKGEWDLMPSCIKIMVVDKSGNNLMKEETPGNLLEADITLTYKGKTYSRLDMSDPWLMPDKMVSSTGTKALPPAIFNGLQTYRTPDGDFVCLVIGYFDQDESFGKETFTIDWGDGTSNVIGYSQAFSWKNNKPDMKAKYWLDGKEITRVKPFESKYHITIVK